MASPGSQPRRRAVAALACLAVALAGMVWDDCAVRRERAGLQAENALLRESLQAVRAPAPALPPQGAGGPPPIDRPPAAPPPDPLAAMTLSARGASGPTLEAALQRLRPVPRAATSPFGSP